MDRPQGIANSNETAFFHWLFFFLLGLAMLAPRPAPARGADAYGRAWMRTELKGFHRLDSGLIVDERESRTSLHRLQQLRADAIRFVEGGEQPIYRAAFRAVVTLLSTTPEQTSLLQMNIPPLGADQFGPRATLLIVRPDGRLQRPPQPLFDETAHGSQGTCARAFAYQWNAIRADLMAGRAIEGNRLSNFERALAEWKAISQETMADSGPWQQAKAKSYLNTATILVNWLHDEKRTEKLSQYLRSAPLGFGGGTVADLARHVLEHDLTVRYGTEAQALLTELTYDMTHQLDSRIAVLEDRIERYKAQNPAHNAAIKERLIAGSCCYPYYPWWHYGYYGPGYSRPSTFNFPQGSQPAGLQSRAYGRPLPQLPPSEIATSAARGSSRIIADQPASKPHQLTAAAVEK